MWLTFRSSEKKIISSIYTKHSLVVAFGYMHTLYERCLVTFASRKRVNYAPRGKKKKKTHAC